MPIFEYCCMSCGSHFEKLRKATEMELIECPECGSAEVKKEMSVFSSSVGASSTGNGCFSGG